MSADWIKAKDRKPSPIEFPIWISLNGNVGRAESPACLMWHDKAQWRRAEKPPAPPVENTQQDHDDEAAIKVIDSLPVDIDVPTFMDGWDAALAYERAELASWFGKITFVQVAAALHLRVKPPVST